jgi:hypothetical protein
VGIWYCTREDVQGALDSKSTARDTRQIDRTIESESRGVEDRLNRRFAPTLATRYKDWPNDQMGRSWRLWLDQDEVISLTAVVAGGITIAPTDYFLEPVNVGPPFNRLEINLGGSRSFDVGATHQRDIALTGLFGHSNDEKVVGTLTADLAASLTATASATFNTARIGVGDLLRIDNERCQVTNKTMVTSGQTLQTPVTASNADTTIQVTNGAAFAVDTVLLLDAERMLVVDIAGNALIVKRAWDGSALAAHTGSTIFTQTGVELDRAQAGTTLASHLNGASISQWQVPGPVRELTIAEVLNTFEQERSGYARTIGSGDNVRIAAGAGIADIRDKAYASHGRKSRIRAV